MFKFGSLPLLIIPVIIYNLLAFMYMAGGSDDPKPEPTPTVERVEPGAAPGALAGGDQSTGRVQERDSDQDGSDDGEAADSEDVDRITAADRFERRLMTIPLPTGGRWDVSSGDLLLTLALALLFLELLKSTSASTSAIVNHAFSLILFVGCLVQFLLIPAFATSVFFLLMMMTLLDVLAGFIVTIVAARRDIAVGDGGLD